MIRLDALGSRPPRLPKFRWSGPLKVMASLAVHAVVATSVVWLAERAPAPATSATRERPAFHDSRETMRVIFIAPRGISPMRGGGGGGNRQPGPIRRAQGIGSDPITLHIAKPIVIEDAGNVAPTLPGVLLDAKPLASGTFQQLGLPEGGDPNGLSTGSGSGGGVGTGAGTGIGPGAGPGIGPGAGGGTGGGVYRPGGSVTPPRLKRQVKPTYTEDALLQKVQGTVVLEVVVTRDGRPTQIRVVRSLDPGLDQQAMLAASQWEFEPGRLGGTPVDVLVTIMLEFWIH